MQWILGHLINLSSHATLFNEQCSNCVNAFFCALGFKLDCQLHQVIVARFADEQLLIDFDNFVRCMIRLETLFSEYFITTNLHWAEPF